MPKPKIIDRKFKKSKVKEAKVGDVLNDLGEPGAEENSQGWEIIKKDESIKKYAHPSGPLIEIGQELVMEKDGERIIQRIWDPVDE